MSSGHKTTKYAAAALVTAVAIILASTFYLGTPAVTSSRTTTSGQYGPGTATLVVETTDPPEVPAGTTSLNMTYSAISILVGEPQGGGQQTVKQTTLTPSGGNATLDLLSLENISQTVASAGFPNGTVVYSLGFTVVSIAIRVNGATSPVALATGGNSLNVTLARPTVLEGTNVALLELNPLVVDTPTGYQLIPNAIGIIKVHPQLQMNEMQTGFRHPLSSQDFLTLSMYHGNISADLLVLRVSGNVTTIEVQVNNTGTNPVLLQDIGVAGNFSASGLTCSVPSPGSGMTYRQGRFGCGEQGEIVLVPTLQSAQGATTTGTGTTTITTELTPGGCSSAVLSAFLNTFQYRARQGITLNPGQCVDLEFVGVLTFGFGGPHGGAVFIPSTQAGQVYRIQVVAAPAAFVDLNCTLPLSNTRSCSVVEIGYGRPLS